MLAEFGQQGIFCKGCLQNYILTTQGTCTLAAQGDITLQGCKTHGLHSTKGIMCIICFTGYMRDGRGGCTRATSVGCLEANGTQCAACDWTNGFYEVAVTASGNKVCRKSGGQLIFGGKILSTSLVIVALLAYIGF